MKNNFQIKCDECEGSGFVPIIIKGKELKRICPICKGTGFDSNATDNIGISASDNNAVRKKLINLLYGHSLDTEEDVGYVADILINAGMIILTK